MDGENGMLVIDKLDTPMEDGMMESLCDVTIRTTWLLANYLGFTGRDECVLVPRGMTSSDDDLRSSPKHRCRGDRPSSIEDGL